MSGIGDWLNPFAGVTQLANAAGIGGNPMSDMINQGLGGLGIPTSGSPFASNADYWTKTVGPWDKPPAGSVMTPAGMNYDPNIPGSGQFSGPGGNPNWSFSNPMGIMAGLGAYTRPTAPAAQVGQMPTAGVAAPPPPPAQPHALHISERPHYTQQGTFAGGWGTGAGARQFETSSNGGRSWNMTPYESPNGQNGAGWSQTGTNSYTRKF